MGQILLNLCRMLSNLHRGVEAFFEGGKLVTKKKLGHCTV